MPRIKTILAYLDGAFRRELKAKRKFQTGASGRLKAEWHFFKLLSFKLDVTEPVHKPRTSLEGVRSRLIQAKERQQAEAEAAKESSTLQMNHPQVIDSSVDDEPCSNEQVDTQPANSNESNPVQDLGEISYVFEPVEESPVEGSSMTGDAISVDGILYMPYDELSADESDPDRTEIYGEVEEDPFDRQSPARPASSQPSPGRAGLHADQASIADRYRGQLSMLANSSAADRAQMGAARAKAAAEAAAAASARGKKKPPVDYGPSIVETLEALKLAGSKKPTNESSLQLMVKATCVELDKLPHATASMLAIQFVTGVHTALDQLSGSN